MIISYKSGLDILLENEQFITNGEIKLLMFFLGTKGDPDFLKSLIAYSTDIHYLTGKHCLALLFLPPSQRRSRDFETGPFLRFDESDDFIDAMTQNSYELANLFDIPYDELPAVVLVNPHNLKEFVVWRTLERNIDGIFRDLRQMFSKWYEANSFNLLLEKVAKLDPLTERFKNDAKITEKITSIVDEKVIPVIEQSMIEAAKEYKLSLPKIMNCISEMKKDCSRYSNLSAFLNARPFVTLKLNTKDVTFSNFIEEYRNMARTAVLAAVPSPQFNFKKIERMGSEFKIKRFSTTYLRKLFKIKEIELDFIKIVKLALKFEG